MQPGRKGTRLEPDARDRQHGGHEPPNQVVRLGCSLASYGGGKSVIIADPRRDKTPALLRAMGHLIESLGGRYITAYDVGTTLADLVIMREVTRHAAGATAAAQQALPVTAFGVFEALRAAAEVCLDRSDLEGCESPSRGWAMSVCHCAATCR